MALNSLALSNLKDAPSLLFYEKAITQKSVSGILHKRMKKHAGYDPI
jgi:hypothetical protein